MTEPAPEPGLDPGPVATASGEAPPPRWTPLGDAALTIRFEGVAPDRGGARILPRVLAAVARLDATGAVTRL
jgi:hypothetical protein